MGVITWGHELASLDRVDGRPVKHSAPYRYVRPSELDLMARLAGLQIGDRWAGWNRAPFTSDTENQVAVYEKPVYQSCAASMR
jgi:hypothetical protein